MNDRTQFELPRATHSYFSVIENNRYRPKQSVSAQGGCRLETVMACGFAQALPRPRHSPGASVPPPCHGRAGSHTGASSDESARFASTGNGVGLDQRYYYKKYV
ncbi:hypothetical protein AvCA_21650 [Azotobacter vinelandii CA]|uniref:Uncharacterized protein n=2 Tax=Azotobacter vinelandii TaxID=354 RepID=C1DFF6_AZOVD|nr:hypothetical protein Avin_21650 [Azotobacter vinelandii DJ]AGK16768.1 hypothetical protein AvCA_21650 [Azotobacter vinelandii CA]AGK20445.1 hypothetical protein AvCA6_21650 [Azotobacter vinelandii CA6]